MAIKLKKEFKEMVVGFKGKSGPLGNFSEKDLNAFYENARQKNYEQHLEMFEGEHDQKQSDAAKVEDFNKKQSIKTAPEDKAADAKAL